jgi:hypothetical protein
MRRVAAIGLFLAGCSGPGGSGDKCQPGDVDGIVGGKKTVGVTVDDDGFSPTPITAQNQTTMTIQLRNTGTKPHGFAIGCVATPNDNGCPAKSCFPGEARIDPVEPGGMGTARFVVPLVEQIYPVTSTAEGDAIEGQFVVQ